MVYVDKIKTASVAELARDIINLQNLAIYDDNSLSFELSDENGDINKIEYKNISDKDLKSLIDILGYINILLYDEDNEISVFASYKAPFNIGVLNHGVDITDSLFKYATSSAFKLRKQFYDTEHLFTSQFLVTASKVYQSIIDSQNLRTGRLDRSKFEFDLNYVLSAIRAGIGDPFTFEEKYQSFFIELLDKAEEYSGVDIKLPNQANLTPYEMTTIRNILQLAINIFSDYNNISDKDAIISKIKKTKFLQEIFYKSGKSTSRPSKVCNPEVDKNAEVFIDLQNQQNENLSQQEREAIILYKTALYNAINTIVRYVRTKGLTIEEALADTEHQNYIMSYLAASYKEFHNGQLEDVKENVYATSPIAVRAIFSRYPNGLLNEEQYNNLVLGSIPLLSSSLSKVKLSEDIIVYRGIANGARQLNWDHGFLSTSISFQTAKEYSNELDRGINGHLNSEIIQITIPKGSSVICYSNSLFYNDNSIGFNEPQGEILIDIDDYDMELTSSNSHIIGDRVTSRANYRLTPKSLSFDMDNASGKKAV